MIKILFSGGFGFLLACLIIIGGVSFWLFNLAPITYIVYITAITISIYWQCRFWHKGNLSSKVYARGATFIFISTTLIFGWLIADWGQHDIGESFDRMPDYEYSTSNWKLGWPDDSVLPDGLKEPNCLPAGITKISVVRTDVAWASAYPFRYVVLEGDPAVIKQYEDIAKQSAPYQAQISKHGVLRDFQTGEMKRFISHPRDYRIVESIIDVPITYPSRSFIEWLRFAPRKETREVVNDISVSTANHRLYVFEDNGKTRRPHYIELLISDDGRRAIFYQSN